MHENLKRHTVFTYSYRNTPIDNVSVRTVAQLFYNTLLLFCIFSLRGKILN